MKKLKRTKGSALISKQTIIKFIRELEGKNDQDGFSKKTKSLMKSAINQLNNLSASVQSSEETFYVDISKLEFFERLAKKTPNQVHHGFSHGLYRSRYF